MATKKTNKKGIVQSETAKWILAIILLVVVVIIIFFLSGKGQALLQKIFDMLRFGS
ncbi:MAG: hypothetical protein KJ767_03575 [Nanoarchaeota archaeon]|nr:hypothetical protein [Nanoarchaeota archaeon]